MDDELCKNIIIYTKDFWERVLIPEYFLKRVPRALSAIDIDKVEIDFDIK